MRSTICINMQLRPPPRLLPSGRLQGVLRRLALVVGHLGERPGGVGRGLEQGHGGTAQRPRRGDGEVRGHVDKGRVQVRGWGKRICELQTLNTFFVFRWADWFCRTSVRCREFSLFNHSKLFSLRASWTLVPATLSCPSASETRCSRMSDRQRSHPVPGLRLAL